MQRAIFIGATGQNVGKTTLCLGIIASLKKRHEKIGFIKPVGQQHVEIENAEIVDKDAVLFKKQFGLKSSYKDMSPVILPAGFTRDYLDGKYPSAQIEQSIKDAFLHINANHDYTIVEGTGHIGVGSIVGMNNARAASILGLDMVIISSGGLGSAYDELALNIAMCKQYGVKVQGVILNRVLDEKRQMILDYFPKALKQWNIPLIGCVPFCDFLSLPTMKDFETLFKSPIIAGHDFCYCHYQNHRLVAGSLDAYHDEKMPNELIITPASREDVIFATLELYSHVKKQEKSECSGGLILTGRQLPTASILEEITKADIPSIYAPICSYDAMKKITSFTAKIRTEDSEKVSQAIKIVEKNIELDLLYSRIQSLVT